MSCVKCQTLNFCADHGSQGVIDWLKYKIKNYEFALDQICLHAIADEPADLIAAGVLMRFNA